MTEPPVLVHFGRAACRNLQHSLGTEWLETNGLGDYASSTLPCCPARRYHGLLVARPEGLPRRYVFLSRFDETVSSPEGRVGLSMADWGDALAPEGWRNLESFELAPHPVARYRAGAGVVRREVLMARGLRAVLVRWSAEDTAYDLELRPLFSCREADHVAVENDALEASIDPRPRGFSFQPYPALPPVDLAFSRPVECLSDPIWYRGQRFALDEARGYPDREDPFCPAIVRTHLAPGSDLIAAASLDPLPGEPSALWRQEVARRRAGAARALERAPSAFWARAELAADDFLARGPERRLGIVAGYPWFGEWGRDTFIALPGLTLARGKVEACEEALRATLPYLRDGLVPNVFGPTPETSDYGSADAALWFARCVRLWEETAGSRRALLVRELLPALEGIAESYRAGTGLGIAADSGELLAAGSAELNATWMDARTGEGPVTPRAGCAVEVNALWYSLLRHLESLFAETGQRKKRRVWQERRRTARRSFLERFWLDEGYLADCWQDGRCDRAVRPNMVIAAALELSPLTRVQRAAVVERARAELLTPRGLRTLAPGHPDYVGEYSGGPEQRDRAYHQGTVWPWLLGFYVEAHLRAFGTRKADRDLLRGLWEGFLPELDRAGLNHVSEVFSGDPPHEPGGTIAQAWNTAELLRSLALVARGRP